MKDSSRSKSRSKIWREKCRENKLCIRCGLANERWPLVLCGICAVKASFRTEEWRERNRNTHSARIRALEDKVARLEILCQHVNVSSKTEKMAKPNVSG